MKKILFAILIIILSNSISYAYNEEEMSTEGVIQLQKDNLKITDFLDESKKYSSELLEDINIDSLFTEAVSGEVNKSSLINKIIKKLFSEFTNSLGSIALIFVVVLIHSILKSVTDGLENTSVSEVTYYVTYILIVTVIMKNFNEIITLMKNSIENLVSFVNCLFPILLTLLISSGGITTAATLQPIILTLITIISNVITKIIIPFALISIALNIVSNVSNKVQIGKLSKYINSSVIWTLGILLTVFVGVTSLDGTIGKRCR